MPVIRPPNIQDITVSTEDLSFYHGTSANAARAILADGASDSLGNMGARALAAEIWQALLKHGDEASFKALFDTVGLDERLSISALRQIVVPNAISRYDYRHFYGTLNLANAYRYAINSPYHSEFLQALAESLKVLSYFGDPLPAALPSRYPSIERALRDTSASVVLELKGIRYNRLTADDGDKDVEDVLRRWVKMNTPPRNKVRLVAVRIKKVRPLDIIAVHDVRDWRGEIPLAPWQIPPPFIEKTRMKPKAWLSMAIA